MVLDVGVIKWKVLFLTHSPSQGCYWMLGTADLDDENVPKSIIPSFIKNQRKRKNSASCNVRFFFYSSSFLLL